MSQGSGGWFGFSGRKNITPRTESLSLTEQFIRFLESESRELSEQPTLSIRVSAYRNFRICTKFLINIFRMNRCRQVTS